MKEKITDTGFLFCPLRNILSRVFEKWALVIMYELNRHEGGMRTGELSSAIPDVSNRMLTAALRKLEADGLVNRKIYPEVPPRVEYSLTERARSLMKLLQPLIGWSIDNFADIMTDRKKFENNK